MPAGMEGTELLRGRPVVCLRADSPLAALPMVGAEYLLGVPLIAMRARYVTHRYVHRLLSGRVPVFSYSTDGAEMGRLTVAEGLGATVLPDFSVAGDPLERAGTITYRPIADDTTREPLMLQRRRAESVRRAARDLNTAFVRRAPELTVA
ncbi:hypothetical protein M878_40965 [Streptomyces roseochromogenus subsp. oscitans DS 12.976]|uniref:LysR substrate-binding domain-containing protein n=1 Tax=Streptomyces roseochromogenus subsp. oscitans DS 12.976 TaxID=1352936 RepID=V6JLE8_STRRC|nr:hypothetical protein M878_40965 [Streptomyces roseochromogenus subsp. oscitans DS 12.976]